MKKSLKKLFAGALAAVSLLALAACGGSDSPKVTDTPDAVDDIKTYKIGLCNYVDDASLNQIVDNIRTRLDEIGEDKGVSFEILYDNCNADANVLSQIVANFQADSVDLMIGVATPVAIAMQTATEGTETPVVFSAVSDPLSAGLLRLSGHREHYEPHLRAGPGRRHDRSAL